MLTAVWVIQSYSSSSSSSQRPHADAGPLSATTAASISRTTSPTSPPPQKWLTAEEEKTRLFNEAQATARRLQGLDGGDTPVAGGSSSYSASSPRRVASPQTSVASAGAALYQQAMSSINRPPAAGQSSHSHSNSQSHSHSQAITVTSRQASPPTSPRTPKSPAPNYPSADEEKAALRRYHEAKAAVDRSQTVTYYGSSLGGPEPPQSAPISYDDLYPPPPGAPPCPSRPPTDGDLPPAFDQGGSSSQAQPSWMSEKERLRRAYETQDAAASAAQRQPPPPVNGDLPPAFDQGQGQSSHSQQPQWMSEKERLRRAYEAQDAAAGVHASPALSAVGVGRNGPIYTQPPPPVPTTTPPPSTYAPPPAPTTAPPPPPISPPSTSHPYNSAAAEKERLKRMYEAQDAAASSNTPPTPPPPRSRSGTTTNGTTGGRPMPQPRSPPIPPSGSGSQPLSAAEEKARLRAMYDAEDRQANGLPTPIPYSQVVPQSHSHPYTNGVQRLPSITGLGGTPPPLAPRPPKEYIQETQEEDARLDYRLRAIDHGDGSGSADTHQSGVSSGSSGAHYAQQAPHLKLTPFAPDSLNRSETDLRPPVPAKKLYID